MTILISPSNPNKLRIIEAAKGVGILLVVLAHLVKYGTIGVPDWYAVFKFKVYLFHMPLLMFMSGYVFYYSNQHTRALNNFKLYATQRSNRLLVPFIIIGIATIVGKYIFSYWVNVDEPPRSLTSGLLSIFIDTESSPVLTIWYLFVLFVYCLITPVILLILKNKFGWLGVLSLVMYFIQIPDFLYGNRIFQFYVFFVVGCLASQIGYLQNFRLSASSFLATALFCLSIIIFTDRNYGPLVCGLLSCIAIPTLILMLPNTIQEVLVKLGQLSMTIYLFNVILIGIAKVLYFSIVPVGLQNFTLLLLFTFVFGLFGPIFLRKTFLMTPFINRFFSKYFT